jgi:SAM-dependent methyltransferase
MSKSQNKSEAVGVGVRMQLLQMNAGYLLSRALYVAAELGIADHLIDGSKSAAELARATDSNTDALYRLLRALASNRIFAEDAQGRFALTPLANALRSDVAGSLRDAIRMVDDRWWNAYGQLIYSVKTGLPAYEQVIGLGPFEYDKRHPDSNQRFARGMASFSDRENLLIAAAYDFSPFKCVVDVGGGRGGFIAEVLKAYPTTRGILYDRPDVVDDPGYVIAAGVADRCQFIGGDFFSSVPAGCDAYVVKRVIPDWPDDRAEKILRNCRLTMAKEGRVLLVDAVILPGNAPYPSKVGDLWMMVVGGRERTEEEFRSLYDRAGLQLTRIIPTRTVLSIIEGAPK